MLFGLFAKKNPKDSTLLARITRAIYGGNPPEKTANVDQAVALAADNLLGAMFDVQAITRIATALYEGPIPYSTHDLAVSVALNVFKNVPAKRRQDFFEIQLMARMTVLKWTQEGKVVKPLLGAFENTLYDLYKPGPEMEASQIRQEKAAKKNIKGAGVKRASFPVGEYRLGEPIAPLTGLVEFTDKEYAMFEDIFGPQFLGGENHFRAPTTSFLSRNWKVSLRAVNGQITRICPSLALESKEEADAVVLETLKYCNERLGEPRERDAQRSVWNTTDGTVTLATQKTSKGWDIDLYLRVRPIRSNPEV